MKIESLPVFKGVFWYVPCRDEFVVKKAACSLRGKFLSCPREELLNRTKNEFNHEKVWGNLKKDITENKPYNYYPRGRVQIKRGKAVVFMNINIPADKVEKIMAEEFNLTKEAGIKRLDIKIDMKKHYHSKFD